MIDLKNSPQEYCNNLNPTKIQDVFDSPTPSLATINRELGLMQLKAALVFPIVDLLDFFNVPSMSDRQIAQTINLIIETYPYLKMDDIVLCFKKVKKGSYDSAKTNESYERVYNRIDGRMIMDWLKRYDSERFEEAQTISINEANLVRSKCDGRNDRLTTLYDKWKR